LVDKDLEGAATGRGLETTFLVGVEVVEATEAAARWAEEDVVIGVLTFAVDPGTGRGVSVEDFAEDFAGVVDDGEGILNTGNGQKRGNRKRGG
jgi:hypothetical protein